MATLHLHDISIWENLSDSFWIPLWNSWPVSSLARKDLSLQTQKVQNVIAWILLGPERLYFSSEIKKIIYQPTYSLHLSFYERESHALKNLLTSLIGIIGSVPLRPIFMLEMVVVLIKSILDILLILPIYSLSVRLLVNPNKTCLPDLSTYEWTGNCRGTFMRLVQNSYSKLIPLLTDAVLDKSSLKEHILAEIFVLLSSIDDNKSIQSGVSLEQSPEPILQRVDDLILLSQRHGISIQIPKNLIDRYVAAKNEQLIPTTTDEIKNLRNSMPLVRELYKKAGAW